MKPTFKNKELARDLDNIIEYDDLKSTESYDDEIDHYIIDVNDASYFYENESDRNSDFEALKKYITSTKNEMTKSKDNLINILKGLHSVDNRMLFLLQECASMLDNMDSNELEQLFQTSSYKDWKMNYTDKEIEVIKRKSYLEGWRSAILYILIGVASALIVLFLVNIIF